MAKYTIYKRQLMDLAEVLGIKVIIREGKGYGTNFRYEIHHGIWEEMYQDELESWRNRDPKCSFVELYGEPQRTNHSWSYTMGFLTHIVMKQTEALKQIQELSR